MQLQTTIDLPSFPFGISHKDHITFIGSCFADNIGLKFGLHKFNSLSNPFGVLYNPLSVCQCIDTIIANKFDDNQLLEHNGIWHSFSHHSTFSNTDKEECVKNISKAINEAHQHLLNSDVLFLTFGTAQVFEKDNKVVSNCHKLPAKEFTRRRLCVSEIVAKTKQTLESLKKVNPKIKVTFTVSPVRYPKDGMNENSLSKATLLLAIEELCLNDDCFYFPAYEIILDELRDYRFFAEDMTHPNQVAIDYVWEKMENTIFDQPTKALCKQVSKITTAAKHRPFNTDPKAHQDFLRNMHKKASDLQSQHPEIDLSEEMEYFNTK
jgi:hypothetical protein